MCLADLLGLVGLTLLEGLSDAENDREAVVEGSAGLLGDELGGLVEDRAALRVTEDDVGDLGLSKLGRATWQRNL